MNNQIQNNAPYRQTERPYFSQSFIDADVRQRDFPTKNHVLFVDNRDRNRAFDDKGGYATNTAPYCFTVNMEDIARGRFENVVSVEMKSLVFPKIADEPYVVVDIEEFRTGIDTVNATDPRNDDVFAVAYFDGVTAPSGASGGMPAGDLKAIRGVDFYKKIVTFNPPLATLHKMNVNFKKYGGQKVTKADVANVEHVSFILEVVTANKNVGRIL